MPVFSIASISIIPRLNGAMCPDHIANKQFEDDVRRVAEAVWELPPGAIQPQHYTTDSVVRELDGLARLRDVTHLVMATTSTKLDKVKSDVAKLNAAAKIEGRSAALTAQWLITSKQLEAEHIKYARDRKVTALTLSNFRSRVFNGRAYVEKREKAAFGSARNLADGTITIPNDEYVPLPMSSSPYDAVAGKVRNDESRLIDVGEIAVGLRAGKTFVMLAPFGSGKSLTAREVFGLLGRDLLRGDSEVTPLAINLRENWGNLYADEILERHARSLGFTPRETLTIAWRMGIAPLILDGFDELAAQAVVRSTDLNFLRDARAQALKAVRDLIQNTPTGVGILIAGRDHYFDNLRELQHSLGLHGRSFEIVRLDEFTEAQATLFLRKYGEESGLPDWLPRKPLILGYLAHKKLLPDILAIDHSRGFGYAWNTFLDLVCERESAHELASMNPITVRHVLERLASDVRATPTGTGPIAGVDLAEAYRLETGEVASEGVLMQLQRLPGLTPREQDPGARSFVDEDLLAALQGSAIARLILEGAGKWSPRNWLTPLEEKGVAMASYLVSEAGGTAETAVSVALRLASVANRSQQENQVIADVASVALEMARELATLDARSLVVESATFKKMDLEDLSVDHLFLRNCVIEEIRIGPRIADSSLRVTECLLGRVVGVATDEGLPEDIFVGCMAEQFDDTSTTAAALRLRVPAGVKALVTVIRKLYFQAGGGRRLAALKRGITDPIVAACIDDIVHILEAEGMIWVSNAIAHPARRQTARARKLLAELSTSQDPVMRRALEL
ncbi:MAG: hypothetical protein ACSLFK_16470 [Gemmatimonadaceae bacterium]